MRLFRFSTIEILERKIISWLYIKRYRVLTLSIIIFLVILLNFLPYVSLFFNIYFATLIIIFLSPIVLDLNIKPFIVFGLLLIVLSYIFWIFSQSEADLFAEYAFIFFLAGSFKAMISSEGK
jgi:hypothetical protein